MSLVRGVESYLDTAQVAYKIIRHSHTTNAYDSAQAAHLPGESVVKAVLLRDLQSQNYTLALIPATHRLYMRWVNEASDRDMVLAEEAEVAAQFPDCDQGAVPGFSEAYAMDVIWDEALLEHDFLYFEAGSHEDLIEISRRQFDLLFEWQPHSVISLSHADFNNLQTEERRTSIH